MQPNLAYMSKQQHNYKYDFDKVAKLRKNEMNRAWDHFCPHTG